MRYLTCLVTSFSRRPPDRYTAPVLPQVLDKMTRDWEGVEFRIVDYKDTGTFIMGGADEVQVSSPWWLLG